MSRMYLTELSLLVELDQRMKRDDAWNYSLVEHHPTILASIALDHPELKDIAIDYLNRLETIFGFSIRDVVASDGLILFEVESRPHCYTDAIFDESVALSPGDRVLCMTSRALEMLAIEEPQLHSIYKKVYEIIKQRITPRFSGNA